MEKNRAPFDLNKIGRLLVGALVNLGDVVLTTGLLAKLKEANPKLHITMLVRPFAKEILENNPVVDEVLVFDYKSKQKSWGKMFDMAKLLREKNFDACISLDRKLRPAILTYLAGIPIRIVPERIFDDRPSRVTWLYNRVLPQAPDFTRRPQYESFQRPVMDFFGLTGDLRLPVLGKIERRHVEKAEELIAGLPSGKLKVALCVQGSFPLKTWPQEYFLWVMAGLREKYEAVFYIIGAPGDFPYAEEFVRKSEVPVQNFCGKTSLKDLMALFGKSDLFLTVDTGAMHIASCVDVPIVALFSCVLPDRYPPLTEKKRLVSARSDCSPCHYAADACPYLPKPKCEYDMTPEMVLEAVDELLAEVKREGV